MAYAIPTIAEIRTEALTVWKGLDDAISISQYSDAWIRTHTLACVLWGVYRYGKWVEEQVFPDSADSINLERHAARYGLTKSAATTSSSSAVRLTGNVGVTIAAGLVLQHVDGTVFETSSGGTFPAGEYLDVSAVSTTTGDVANKESGETLTLVEPPVGVDASATIQSSFAGGEDAESNAGLLARLLSRLQDPPAGGKASDYVQWALAVAGVAEAFAYPLRRGPGTCDVVVLTSASDRLPTAELLSDVQAALDAERPVTAYETLAIAPDLVTQDVTATIWIEEEAVFAVVQAAVEAAVEALFAGLGPGETLYLSHVETVISGVTGVVDREVSEPAGNVAATVSGDTVELVSPGSITISEGV